MNHYSSDYKRGKVCCQLWAAHWDAVAEMAEARTTIEARLIEYQTAIRGAFTSGEGPNVLLMTPRLRQTHLIDMQFPPVQREKVLVWHLGDVKERKDLFGSANVEGNEIKAIYRKVGRRINDSRQSSMA